MLPTGRMNSRVKGLERHSVDVSRQPDGYARIGSVLAQRNGRWKGKLDEALEQGSSAMVSLWWHNGTSLADTGTNVEAYDWFLLDGESIEAETKVEVEFHADGKWWVIAAGCSPDDTSTSDSLAGGTSGSSLGNDDMAFDPIGPGDLVFSGGSDSFFDGNLA